VAPHYEEQAPPSGGSLALLLSSSYLKHEQPEIGPYGSGLSNVSMASYLEQRWSTTLRLGSALNKLGFIDKKVANFTRLDADVHRDEKLILKVLEDSITKA